MDLRLAALGRMLLLAALGCALLAAPAAAARRQVPVGFLGVSADGPLLDPDMPTPALEQEFDQMVRSGVESVRVGVYWSRVQPYPDAASIPSSQTGQFQMVDGIPSDFAAIDRIYEEAAARGLRVLPVILQAPPWARKHPSLLWSPPASATAYGAFVGTVVRRYDPQGTLWAQPALQRAHPTTTQWQIWNEPAGGFTPDGVSAFWQDPGVPFEPTYVAMLRAARAQLKAADPSGQLVLGGLFGRDWLALQDLYTHGARGLFDAVGVDTYTKLPFHVTTVLRLTRAVMNRNHDRRMPLLLTEVSWPSAAGKILSQDIGGYEVTPAQEAQRVTAVVKLLAARRRRLGLTEVYWYTWVSPDTGDTSPFFYAGLRHANPDGSIVPKPAQGAFRQAARRLEGCTKVSQATTCA